MKNYPKTESEKKLGSIFWRGSECECGCRAFEIESGGSSCCAWIKFICLECKKEENWDIGTGECQKWSEKIIINRHSQNIYGKHRKNIERA